MVERVVRNTYLKLCVSLLLGLSLAFLTFSLGQWQVRRAAEKTALHEAQGMALLAPAITPTGPNIDLKALAYRKLSVRGHFMAGAVVMIDNRQFNGQPAVQFIQGFQPEGASYLIPVDRGLLLRDPRAPREAPSLPPEAMNVNVFELHATMLPHFERSAELWGMKVEGSEDVHQALSNGFAVWSNFNPALFERFTQHKISNFFATEQPVVFDETNSANGEKVDGFYISAVQLPEQVARHKGYAFQWFAMTVALLLLTCFFVYKEWRSLSKPA